MSKVPSEEVQRLLKTVYERCTAEDEAPRQRQIRQWRRLKLMWEGFSQIWYSETAHDWRVWDELTDAEQNEQSAYDKPINVFRSYLESIIAALSVTVPAIKAFPDDADNVLDLSTAKAADKIGELIYRHNDAGLIWLHALFIFVTEGCTAFYTYVDTDEEYGTYEQKEYEDGEESETVATCPNCGYELSRIPTTPNAPSQPNPQMPQASPDAQNPQQLQQPQMTQQQADDMQRTELSEFNPGDDDSQIQYALHQGQDLCPACMTMMDPLINEEKFVVTRLVGTSDLPKSRVCIEPYGGLYVRIPNYAKTQKDIPYLIFSKEINYVQAIEEYENLQGNRKLIDSLKGQAHSSYTLYEQWGRLSPQYQGEYPINVVTISKAWLRPCSFNFLEKEDANKLKRLYPNGAKLTLANDEFAEAENESLDDHWTLTENPMSDFLHFAPLGQTLVSVQEITNDVISLILQTIEHGIGQTFADPSVMNFNAYEQTEVVPGGIFPAVPKSGKSLQDAFYELRTATLSAEVMPFYNQIQSAGQITSGALPSIFGGQIEGSDTASEYSMSRAQALQRLQNTWKLFCTTWKNMFGKVIPMYIQEVQYDERQVTLTDDGDFVNNFIYRADLDGKIGRIELEANENLPLTWGQKRDMFMQMLTNTNPLIQQILQSPDNLAEIHEALGMDDWTIPGEDEVLNTYDDIKTLLSGQPMPTGNPMDPMAASLEVDPILHNPQIVFEVCRKWAVSEAGKQAKVLNPPGYQNVLLYARAYNQIIQQQQQQQMMVQEQMHSPAQPAQAGNRGAAPPAKPNANSSREAPITGDNDVQAVH